MKKHNVEKHLHLNQNVYNLYKLNCTKNRQDWNNTLFFHIHKFLVQFSIEKQTFFKKYFGEVSSSRILHSQQGKQSDRASGQSIFSPLSFVSEFPRRKCQIKKVQWSSECCPIALKKELYTLEYGWHTTCGTCGKN